MEYRIIELSSIQHNTAEVIVESGMGKEKASLEYNPASGQLSFKMPGASPILFNQRDKYGFVFINGGDKINVRSTPVSGNPLTKAHRGQSFRFLGKEKGWFKVELSKEDQRAGYISPDYAFYLKDNNIPEEAFTKDYSNGLTSFTLEKNGTQIFMVKTTMYPPQGESIPTSSVETYAGGIDGNALVFNYYIGGIPTHDITEMSEIEPYTVYYWKEPGMFIMEGKNYSADM